MGPERLREGLVRCGGPAFSLRLATKAFIQHCRSSRRSTGAPRPLRSRQALDRVLDLPHEADDDALRLLSDRLRAVVRGEAATPDHALLDRIEAALQAATPRTATEPLRVRVSGWPPGLAPELQTRIVGHAPGALVSPAEAALLVHRLHGHELGGARLVVAPELPPGTVLPAPPRDRRADLGRRGRPAPALRHLDEEGRRSLTPARIAAIQARILGPVHILEPCCGCGGNTVAFAQAGARVTAFERDAERARLARANLRDAGASHRVELRTGDGLAAAVNIQADAIFVDPPWELGGRRLENWSALSAALPSLAAALDAHPVAMLKLPRTFAVQTLPGGAAAWQLRYELGTEATGDDRLVRMITAWRPRP